MDPSRTDMNHAFSLCRSDDWRLILQLVQENPMIATTSMIMDNHISTTILHQAITSKANTQARAKVIQTILDLAPDAAKIKNGYGSLPLHVISQRNTKMDSQTKEHLIHSLVKVYPEALIEEGGVGRRTPLHIAFTDYISPHLARMMIERGTSATYMKDKKGWLPIHVAVSRHCSPEKLRMLLKANPESLHSLTDSGQSILDLAKSTATKSHPNFALIGELEKHLGLSTFDQEQKTCAEDDELVMPEPAFARSSRKRKAEAAELLLSFSRQQIYEHYDEPIPISFSPMPSPMPYHPVPRFDHHFPSQEYMEFKPAPPTVSPPSTVYYHQHVYYSNAPDPADMVGEIAQV